MKKQLLFLAVLAFQGLTAQLKKEVGNFDKLKSFDQITVELIAANEERVEIYGSRSEDVEVINKNGELKIRMRTGKLLDGEEIDAKVYFKKLNRIDANEGSFIGCEKTFDQGSIYVSAQEGAQVKLTLKVGKADFKAATGGKLKINGSATNQDISLGAGGIIEAKDLKTSFTKVSVKAGGEAEVHATDTVDASVTAGGKIIIHGNPKDIKRKTTLGGTIEEVRQ